MNKTEDERGSGRTSAQLMTLGENDIYVVGNQQEVAYVWHLIHHLRPDFLLKRSNIWTAGSVEPYRLTGLNVDIIVDHAAWERLSNRVMDALEEYRARRATRTKAKTP